MLRKLLSFLLMLSVCWSSVSMAAACATAEGSEGIGHAVMHWQDSDHHHHDDGTLHVDDSSGTVHHMHADGASNTAGLLSAHRLNIPEPSSTSPAVAAQPPFPSPVLKGLLRPPRDQA